MRVLIIGLNFAPEPTGVGKYTGEMAAWLAGRGHEVEVITAPPYYPSWQVAEGHSGWRWRREQMAGARVLRCPLYVPRRASGLRRILHLSSFALSSLAPALAAAVGRRPDLVAAMAPTLLSAPAALIAAALARAPAWLHIQDFELDAAARLGMLGKAGAPAGAAQWLERTLLRRFDLVSTISPRMLAALGDKGVPAERSFLLPNWVDIGAIRPLDRPSMLRGELGLPRDRLVALYAGSMGEKQGLELVVEAARCLAAGEASPHFVLAGDGPARPRIAALAQGLPNLSFLPLQPAERMNELLNLADMHLLPQRADVADLVMPSKLGPMLASGRPVVATAAPGTQLAEALGPSGEVVAPGDVAGFAAAIARLAGDPERRLLLGEAARLQAEAELGTEQVLGRLEARLLAAIGGGPEIGEQRPRRAA